MESPSCGQPPSPEGFRARGAEPVPAAMAGRLPLENPQALNAGPDVMSFLRCLRRRWLLAGTLGLLAGIMAASASRHMASPSRYSARALLYVASTEPQVAFPTGEPQADFAIYRQTQLALVKCRLVLTTALQDGQVARLGMVRGMPDAVQWLETELRADYTQGPEILKLTLKGDQPEELKIVVNAVVQAYLREIVNKEHQNRLARLSQLQDLHKNLEASLESKRRELRRLARTAGSKDAHVLAIKQELALKSLNLAQQELLEYQSRIMRQEVELAALLAKHKAGDNLAVADSAIEEALQQDAVIVRDAKDVEQLEATLADIERVAARGRADPTYEKTHRALNSARQALAARRDQLRPAVVENFRQKARGQMQADISQLQDQIAVLKEHVKALHQLVDRLSGETRSINEFSLDLEALHAEISQTEEMTKKMGGEIESLKVEVLAPPRVTPLEEVVVTPTHEEKRQTVMTAVAGLGACGVLLFGVGCWELRSCRVNTVDEVVRRLGVRLLGVLPALPHRRRLALRGGKSDGSYASDLLIESADTMRTMLLHLAQRDALRTIMVASALQSEGKTSLSIDLATSLARAGFRTLLVDADLRRPSIHRLLDLVGGPGLSELLRGEADPAAVVQPTVLDRLALLPAGCLNDHAIRALAQDAWPRILGRLKEEYDYVVVDSSPLLSIADALQIARHVDGVVLSVLRDVSRLPAAHSAYQRLVALGVPVLGVVVRGANIATYGKYYRYAPSAVTPELV